MTLYAIRGPTTQDLLTWQGRPIIHTNRQELEWLLPGAHVVPVTGRDLRTRSPLPPLWLRDHPSLGGLSWPLNRAEFKASGRGGFGRPSGQVRIWSSAAPSGST